MSAFAWERFLKQWSCSLIDSMKGDELAQLPPEVIASGWLGYPGATEAQIAQAEAHLGLTLPPSYREFLKVTNGWRKTTPFIHKLWSIDDIERCAVRHQAWINAFIDQHDSGQLEYGQADDLNRLWEPFSISDKEYFVYGEQQDCSQIRIEYLQTAIEISDMGESCIYLLNPQVVTAEGEWEAWFFGDWLPGADRYRSFREMMEAEYQNFLELRDTPLEQIEDLTETAVNRASEPSNQGGWPSKQPVELTQPDIKAEPKENSEVLAEADTMFELAITRLEEAKEFPTTPTEQTRWGALKQLTIEVHTRQVAGRIEYRTIVNPGVIDQSRTWSAIGEEKLRQWIQQQLDEEIQSNANCL